MTQFSEDDPKLVDFLQRHCPSPPPASPDLEDRILAHLAAPAFGETEPNRRVAKRKSRFWVASSAIAASLVAALVSYRTLAPTQPDATELASLETFIETNWNNTVYGANEEEGVWLSASTSDSEP